MVKFHPIPRGPNDAFIPDGIADGPSQKLVIYFENFENI